VFYYAGRVSSKASRNGLASVRPSVSHTDRDSPEGSMPRGQRTFWPNNKERLRRSRIEGYGPRPRPARDWPVSLSYHHTCRVKRLLEAARHASIV